MQAEIDGEDTLRPVYILGVNGVGAESGNDGMMADRVLPWMQTDVDTDVWTMWDVTFRDVFVVGPGNEKISAFNLTQNDLSDPADYAALKDQLLQAANE